MGNWRTVQIVGTCDEHEVDTLRTLITIKDQHYANFHPLIGGIGLAGLPVWSATEIDVVGNLAERGYQPSDVAKALEKIAILVPSLAVKVHCGGDYESPICIATVTLEHGKATVGDPEIDHVGEIPEIQIMENLLSILTNGR